jgi:hypothetical protein
MTFSEWLAAIVACLRVFLPDARAARKGPATRICSDSSRVRSGIQSATQEQPDLGGLRTAAEKMAVTRRETLLR